MLLLITDSCCIRDDLYFFGTIACIFDVDELQFDLREPENQLTVCN